MSRWQRRKIILCLVTLTGAILAQTKHTWLIGVNRYARTRVIQRIIVREQNDSIGELVESQESNCQFKADARSIQELSRYNSSLIALDDDSRTQAQEMFDESIPNRVGLRAARECVQEKLLISSYASHNLQFVDSLIGTRNMVHDAVGILRVDLAQNGKNARTLPDSNSNKQESMKLLTRLATEQIGVDGGYLGKTRFSIDQQSNTFYYDLSSVPSNFVLSGGDIDASALEALIRVESLRRDFKATIPKETFWIPALESIQQVIEHCVQRLEAQQEGGEAEKECSLKISQQFEALRASITTYAAANNLKLVERPILRDPAPGYTVHVKVNPPNANVRVMTLLEYKKNQYFKIPQEQYRWNELLDSEYDMIGWYHYRADWPAELNGPEEGNFEITKPSTITFRPKTK